MLNSRAFSSGDVITRRSTAAFAAFVALALSACRQEEHEVTAPSNRASGLSVAGGQQPDLDSALAVHRRHTFRLIAIPGVVGTAVGLTANGRTAIKIYTKDADLAGLPTNLEGIPVEVRVTGPFFANPAKKGLTANSCIPNTCSTTEVWPTPVPVGVSTGSNAFLESQCSSGTIGARVKAGAAVYALSNNHVYALENTVAIGTSVLEPGLADTHCSPNGSNTIGTLSAFAPISFCSGTSCANNTIDAAIAASDTAHLDNATPPTAYWVPDSAVHAATLGLGVKKYGRTTSLTRGQVTGIDATVTVSYKTGTAQFVHQIVVSNCANTCTGQGDSGSLWVTNDPSTQPVGLLFAGNANGSTALANPISDVLTYFGVAIDNTPHPTASGGLTASCGLCNPEIVAVAASGGGITISDNGGNSGTITLSGFSATDGGGGCMFGQCWVASVAGSGNTITVGYFNGTNDVITLSGVTASGGLTASCGLCNGVIESVTATGGNEIFLTDNGGNSGYIRLSY